MKVRLIAIAAAAVVTLPALSWAQDGGIATNFGLTSNYKYRGQDQGNNNPAVFGGFDWSSGGFYVGNWNSSIGFTDAGLEMDFYGGYKFEVAGIGFDAGLLHYYYPQKTEVADLDTTELYLGASYGFFGAKYSRTVSSKYFGVTDGDGTGYFAITANPELAKGIVLNLAYGTTKFSGGAKNAGAVNYDDYKVGATFDLGSGFSAAGAYVGATKKDVYGDINKGRVILTLTKTM